MARRTGTQRQRTEKAATPPPAISAEPFQSAQVPEPYRLRLYVAGNNPKSSRAIELMRELCTSFPHGRCELEVVDLYQRPELAKQDNIIAVPTLVKLSPAPRRSFVGLVENKEQILNRLGMPVLGYGRTERKRK